MPTQPLLILAPCHRDAWLYARDHHLGPERRGWRYVAHLHDVLGYATVRYVTLPGACTPAQLTERAQMLQHLRAHGVLETGPQS